MNYEQKYNDLINRLREYRERFGNPLYKEIGEEFPELRESEDERIRKELIEQVQFIVPKQDECDENGKELPCYRERIAKYVAYLEKQKEHQENCTKFLAKILKRSAEGFRNVLKKKGIDYILSEEFWTNTAGTFSKQECNEFYKWMDDMTMELVTEETPEYKKGFKDGLNASKKEQKPMEWNKEDEPKKPDKFPGITRFCDVADNITRIASDGQTTEGLEDERATMQSCRCNDI